MYLQMAWEARGEVTDLGHGVEGVHDLHEALQLSLCQGVLLVQQHKVGTPANGKTSE